MEPKYLLVMEMQYGKLSFSIYEQSHVDGKVGQRFFQGFYVMEDALKRLVDLNGGEPVLLAYSTKPIDNTFSV